MYLHSISINYYICVFVIFKSFAFNISYTICLLFKCLYFYYLLNFIIYMHIFMLLFIKQLASYIMQLCSFVLCFFSSFPSYKIEFCPDCELATHFLNHTYTDCDLCSYFYYCNTCIHIFLFIKYHDMAKIFKIDVYTCFYLCMVDYCTQPIQMHTVHQCTVQKVHGDQTETMLVIYLLWCHKFQISVTKLMF